MTDIRGVSKFAILFRQSNQFDGRLHLNFALNGNAMKHFSAQRHRARPGGPVALRITPLVHSVPFSRCGN